MGRDVFFLHFLRATWNNLYCVFCVIDLGEIIIVIVLSVFFPVLGTDGIWRALSLVLFFFIFFFTVLWEQDICCLICGFPFCFAWRGGGGSCWEKIGGDRGNKRNWGIGKKGRRGGNGRYEGGLRAVFCIIASGLIESCRWCIDLSVLCLGASFVFCLFSWCAF